MKEKLLTCAYCAIAVCHASFLLILVVTVLTSSGGFILDKNHRQIDFRMDYALGKMIFSSQAKQIYDPSAQLIWFNQVLDPPFTAEGSNAPVTANGSRGGYICYIPYFFLLIGPLSSLPETTAFIIWVISSTALGSLGLWMFGRYAGRSALQLAIILIATAASMPAWYCLVLGQTSWFFVGFFCAYFLFLGTRRDLCAAITLALIAIKIQYAVTLSMAILAGRRWKVLIATAVIGIAGCSAAAFYIGWDNILRYPAIVAAAGANPDLDYAFIAPTLVSLRGPFTVLFPWTTSLALTGVCSVAGFLFLAFVWWQRHNSDNKRSFLWASALTVTVGLLTNPHSHIYDCLLLSVPAVATMETLDLGKIVKLDSQAMRIWCLILYCFPIVSLCSYLDHKLLGVYEFIPFTVINLILSVAGYKCFQASLKTAAS